MTTSRFVVRCGCHFCAGDLEWQSLSLGRTAKNRSPPKLRPYRLASPQPSNPRPCQHPLLMHSASRRGHAVEAQSARPPRLTHVAAHLPRIAEQLSPPPACRGCAPSRCWGETTTVLSSCF